ncbi:CpsD/CapB family tyrosine-protein kinase [Paenibacillus kobensis]|uniref:CpsD/CapB family tyrosine-protein kinase n=1 Tax=Paenibacillus kobensis TaxID=59841 RepID=UPI0013E3D183|nr:CpsD/CapB family tyrosine-protein kinase [Paenibacillus kobensis]
MRSKLVTLSGGNAALSERYRSLRAQLEQVEKAGARLLAVVTPAANNGSVEMIANLAVTYAQAGRRTLIIDGDLGNPVLHKLFGLPNAAGFSQVLEGRCSIGDAIQDDVLHHLSVLTAGHRSDHYGDIVGAFPLRERLEQWQQQFEYDMVWVNTPPVLDSADAIQLAGACDRALFVLRSGAVKEDEAVRTRRLLEAAGVSVIGAVLTHHQPRRRWLPFKF